MANQWFKFYGGEYLADTKIATLTAQERSCWITLLCLAGSSTIPGVVDFLTVEVLLKKSGIEYDPYHPEEWDNALAVLKKFERMRMITTSDDGRIELPNWHKRQENPMSVTERVRKYRAKIRVNEENVTDETKRNENVTTEENRIDKNRIEKNKSIDTHELEKSIFGEFKKVKLTDQQYQNLCEQIGETNTQILIVELDTYIESTGKRYKNHYATIQTWYRRKAQDYQKSKAPERRIV
jgi:hypothetical protein